MSVKRGSPSLSIDERRRSAEWFPNGARITITGGALLGGDIHVQGSKNAAQKLVPITALVPGRYQLFNLPEIADTYAVLEIVEFLGGVVRFERDHWLVDTTSVAPRTIPRLMTERSTGTFQFAGALVGRFHWAKLAAPGGDNIGGRPVDLHLEALRSLGVECSKSAEEEYEFEVTSLRGGNTYEFAIPSAGAFINVLIASCAAEKTTTLVNVPWDDDIEAACDLLGAMGALVDVSADDGRNTVVVTPIADPSRDVDVQFTAPPDRNDAATWLVAGAIAARPISVHGSNPAQVLPLLSLLESLGVRVSVDAAKTIRVARPSEIRAPGAMVEAGPSPRLHSDWAQMIGVLLLTCPGRSTLADLMYEGRFSHVTSLKDMGAEIEFVTRVVQKGTLMYDREATELTAIEVTGPAELSGTTIQGTDVRGAMALLLAAAIADGTSTLFGGEQLARGYESLAIRARSVGIQMKVESDNG